MKTYKCKSRIRVGNPCQYNCIVKSEFEPRGCLFGAMSELWEEIKEEDVIISDDRKCGYCGMSNGIHKSNCEFFRNL